MKKTPAEGLREKKQDWRTKRMLSMKKNVAIRTKETTKKHKTFKEAPGKRRAGESCRWKEEGKTSFWEKHRKR